MLRKNPVLAVLFLALIGVMTGCGYHPATSASHLPQAVHTLAIPVFKNTTQSHHTEVSFTQAVVKEFSSRTSYRIINQNDADADATLEGTVTGYQVMPLTYNSLTGQSSSFLITINANLLLKDRNGKVLYKNTSYVFRQQYETTQDLASFIQEDPAAVERLSRDFARTIVSDILESF